MTRTPTAPEPPRVRTPLVVDLAAGRLVTGGHRASFDPAEPLAVELAYLQLVRRMRDLPREPSLVLRRDDVTTLAAALDEDPVTVLERLGGLVGATVTQRRSMATAFLAGAVLIAVATGAAALVPDEGATGAPLAAPTTVASDTGASAVLPPARTDADPGPVDEDTDEPTDEDVASHAVVEDAAGDDGSSPSPAPMPHPVDDVPSPEPTVEPAATPPPADATPMPPPETEPSADGEHDRWSWERAGTGAPAATPGTGPEVVQPGATIDLPPDDGPEEGPSGSGAGPTLELPADDENPATVIDPAMRG